MPRFFVSDSDAVGENTITLTGEDARHLSLSLRARIGEKFTICDGNSREFLCTVSAVTKASVVLSIDSVTSSESEPSVEVTLYQALIKSDKFDDVVKRSVELGVGKIVPVETHFCVSRPDDASMAKKVERWRRISREAAMQSGRGIIPTVTESISFDEAISLMKQDDASFVCYETTPHEPLERILPGIKSAKTLSFLVGPEGGIAKEEAQSALEAGIPLASLGKRILRTETAPLCVLSAVMFASGNLG